MLSIIIPAYNVENYIETTLRSVLDQIDQEIELIVIDDNSTDNTRIIIDRIYKEYKEDKFRIILSKDNNGVSYSRNVGIENSEGQYIYFLDGDDYLSDRFVQSIKFETHNSDNDIIAFAYNTVLPNGNILHEYFKRFKIEQISSTWSGVDALRSIINRKLTINSCSAIYKKEFLLRNKLMFEIGCTNGEDQEFIYKSLSNAQKIKFIHDILVYIVRRPGSVTNSPNIKKFDAIDALLRTADYLHNKDNITLHEIASFIDGHKLASNYLLIYRTIYDNVLNEPITKYLNIINKLENDIEYSYPSIKKKILARIIKSNQINIIRKTINIIYIKYPIVNYIVYYLKKRKMKKFDNATKLNAY